MKEAVALQDLADTAVGDLQLAADLAGTDALVGEVDDFFARLGGQRAPVDELAAELVERGGRARRLVVRVEWGLLRLRLRLFDGRGCGGVVEWGVGWQVCVDV